MNHRSLVSALFGRGDSLRNRNGRPWTHRAIACALVYGQVVLPLTADASVAPVAERATPRAAGAPLAAAPAVPLAVPSQLEARPPLVKVNRTLPRVAPVPATPVFSAVPTEDEIFRARVFEEPLVAVGGSPTAEQNLALSRVLKAYLAGGGGENTAPIEAILEAHAIEP